MSSEKIVILGTGYVGFPLAVILARSGFKVVGVDIRREVVRGINSGDLPIREKEIEAIFKEPAVRANLVASEVVADGDVYVISVPTPLEKRRKIGKSFGARKNHGHGKVRGGTEFLLLHAGSDKPKRRCDNHAKRSAKPEDQRIGL